MFAKELLAFGKSHLSRKVGSPYNRRNKNLHQESDVVEFNRLHRDLERYPYGDPESEPFRAGALYRHPTEKEEELMQLGVQIRKWKIVQEEEESGKRLLDMYGTTDC